MAAGTAGYVDDAMLEFDVDLVSGSTVAIATILKSALTLDADGEAFNFDDYVALSIVDGAAGDLADGRLVRRLTREDPNNSDQLIIVVNASGSETTSVLDTALDNVTLCTVPNR